MGQANRLGETYHPTHQEIDENPKEGEVEHKPADMEDDSVECAAITCQSLT